MLGTIETSSVTKGQTDRITHTGQVVGFYDPRLDSTHRVTGQLFGFGNLLAYLVIAGDARR